MKKIFLAAVALCATMTSCLSEDWDGRDLQYGYINVDVTNDPEVKVRAAQTVTDLKSWKITVDGKELVENDKYPAGSHTVAAKNYAGVDAALSANESWGDAYYAGSTTVTVVAGKSVTANVNCGKAQNGRVKATFGLADNFSNYNIEVKDASSTRTLTFDQSNTTGDQLKLAYFKPETISYTFSYDYKKADGTKLTSQTVEGNLTVAAATEHIINVVSNDNGLITISVSYDDDFANGDDQEITIDAATGEKVEEQN